MSLRIRILLTAFLTIAILLGASYWFTQAVMTESFAKLEEGAIQANTERVFQVIQEEVNYVDRIALSYAQWDETYRYVIERNPEYLQYSLNAGTFANYSLDNAVIYDVAGRVVYEATYNAQTKAIVEGAQSLATYVTNIQARETRQFITRQTDLNGSITGMILLPEGPMMISARPILPSGGNGVITGTLVLGRYLDTLELQSLSDQLRLPLGIAFLDNTTLAADFEQANQAITVESPLFISKNNQTSSTYIPLQDIIGRRILIVRVDMPRDIYTQDLSSQRTLITRLGIGGLLILLVMTGILFLLISRPVSGYSRMIRLIRKQSDRSKRLPVRGNDEFAGLASEINDLMTALEQTSHDASQGKIAQRQSAQAQMVRQITQKVNSTFSTQDVVRTLVDELGDKFGFYYVGVFLLDSSRLYAVLTAGTGNVVPEGYRLTVGGSSTVGLAIGRGQLQQAEIGSHKDQASFTRLPMARSEIAIPIRFERDILGAIAIQATQADSFSNEEDLEVLQHIADHAGSVLVAARLIENSRTNYENLDKRYQQYLTERWVEELRLKGNISYTFQANSSSAEKELQMLEVPIPLQGIVIGQVKIESDRSEWTPAERAIIEALLAQTSQALENARLLERSQRRAAQERLVAEVIREVRSSTSVDTILHTSVLELGRLLRASGAEVRIQPNAGAILLQSIEERSLPGGVSPGVNGSSPDAENDDSQEVIA